MKIKGIRSIEEYFFVGVKHIIKNKVIDFPRVEDMNDYNGLQISTFSLLVGSD